MAGSKQAAFGYVSFPVMRVKEGSSREAWVIQNQNDPALQIANIMPYTEQHMPVGAAGTKIHYVTHHNVMYRLESEFAIPAPGKFEITQDVLGATATEKGNQIKYIDVKIGFFTKSDEQMKLEGFNQVQRTAKLAEHKLKDERSGSRQYGFDLNRELFNALTEIHNHTDLTPVDKLNIKNGLQVALTSLITSFYNAINTITFVGSSILFSVNLESKIVNAAFIDPDHPILFLPPPLPPALMPVPPTLMWQQTFIGLGMNAAQWAEYQVKYKGSFYNGLLNLLTYLDMIDLRNPIPRPARMRNFNTPLPISFP